MNGRVSLSGRTRKGKLGQAVAVCRPYILRFQLFFNVQLPLMEAAELVDFVLILATDFDLVTASGLLILGKLKVANN